MNGIRRSLGRFVPVILIVVSTSESFNLANQKSFNNNNQRLSTQALDRGASSVLSAGLKKSATASTTSLSLSSPNNPFSSLIGDFASSIMGKSDSVKVNSNLDSKLQAAVEPSWPEIRSKLESVQTPEEKAFRNNLVKGYGELGSPLHKIRLYDESNSESDIRVTFYRDHASWW